MAASVLGYAYGMGIQDRDYYREHHRRLNAGQRPRSPGRRRDIHWFWIALGWVCFLGLCYLGAEWYLAHYPLPVRFKSLGRFTT